MKRGYQYGIGPFLLVAAVLSVSVCGGDIGMEEPKRNTMDSG